MNIAIDPDVFRNFHDEYLPTLNLIDQNKKQYRFILCDEIKNQYNECMTANRNYLNVGKHFVNAMIYHLLNETAFLQITVDIKPSPAILSKGVAKGIKDYDQQLKVYFEALKEQLCSEWRSCEISSLNTYLAAIALQLMHSRTQDDLGPTVALLLARKDATRISCTIKPSADVKQCGKMNDIKILSAGETEYLSSQCVDPDHLINQQQQSALFEALCTIWLCNKYRGIGRTRFIVGERDIDAAVLLELGEAKMIYFAECKLLRTEMPNTQAPIDALSQLKMRIDLLRQTARKGGITQNVLVPEAFLISNFYGDNLNNIRNMAQSIEYETKVKIHIIQVEMPSGWQHRIAWDLGDNRFEDIT